MKTIITLLTFIGAISIKAQTFSIDTISDATFQRIYGNSFKHDCKISRSELRYLQLSHYDKEGAEHIGELICNKVIANDLKEIFQELYRLRYPIERMQLIDNFNADDERSMQANNTSCFNYRTIAGSRKLSAHSRGMAIDINPLYNPCIKHRKDGTTSIQPSTARQYADRSKKWPYQITPNDPCYRLFIKHGFKWGGNWRSTKDYQHFER